MPNQMISSENPLPKRKVLEAPPFTTPPTINSSPVQNIYLGVEILISRVTQRPTKLNYHPVLPIWDRQLQQAISNCEI